jgi:hypothetical protein
VVQKVVLVPCDTINPIHGDMVIDEWPPVTILQAMNNLAHCAKVQVSACNLLRDLAEPVLEDKEEDKVEARLLLCIVSGEHDRILGMMPCNDVMSQMTRLTSL